MRAKDAVGFGVGEASSLVEVEIAAVLDVVAIPDVVNSGAGSSQVVTVAVEPDFVAVLCTSPLSGSM